MTTSVSTTHELRARSVAYALLARMLGNDVQHLVDADTRTALATALEGAGLERLQAYVTPDLASLPAESVLAGRWVRWFDLGRVAPYEGSHVASSAGGVTPRLADVAGFYRAFNMKVRSERPDHVVAQLEFLAVALLVEAEQIEADDTDGAEVATQAIRKFVRDHVGRWVTAWAGRVAAIDELQPWAGVARLAAELLAAEAAARNVVPLTDTLMLVADAGLADPLEADLECGDEFDLAAELGLP